MTDDWRLFRGHKDDDSERRIEALPKPPPWRDFSLKDHRARTYRPGDHEIEMVNAALYLRRPLLVIGKPGTGKSSLAYAVADELALGPVLVWPINSRSAVGDGLYHYDAIGRLRDINVRGGAGKAEPEDEALTRYLALGPLGTALLPGPRPRPLLIDEIDKADVDFPNDLLHVLEEGYFDIPEARRIAKEFPALKEVRCWGSEQRTNIEGGRVQCTTFPFVVITSNGERDLPPAFLRRCLRLTIDPPDDAQLRKIVEAHFPELAGGPLSAEIEALVRRVADINREPDRIVAIDQLLGAIQMIRGARAPTGEARARIIDELLRELGQGQ